MLVAYHSHTLLSAFLTHLGYYSATPPIIPLLRQPTRDAQVAIRRMTWRVGSIDTALFVLVAFLAAALAFLVEPLVARSLLPTYGGTSAVWTTALVFFQSTLLAGYAFAHLTFSTLGLRRHAWLQTGLVVGALVVLLAAPLAVPSFARPPDGVPTALWLVGVLAAMVGLPFLVLSSASPTTQRWFAALPGGPNPIDCMPPRTRGA